MRVIGYYRVSEPDHWVRCVTDAAPDENGWPYTAWSTGGNVFMGHFPAPAVLLPVPAAVTARRGSAAYFEQVQALDCARHCERISRIR